MNRLVVVLMFVVFLYGCQSAPVMAPKGVEEGMGYKVHVLGVDGGAYIIDYGETEIIIDGGKSVHKLRQYLSNNPIVDGDIELMVLTHGHVEHYAGLKAVLKDELLKVNKFWLNALSPTSKYQSKGFKRFYRFLKQQGVAIETPKRGKAVDIGKVNILPLRTGNSGFLPYWSKNDKLNSSSMVLKVTLDGVRYLFTGDILGRDRNFVIVHCQLGDPEPGYMNREYNYVEKQLVDSRFDLAAEVLMIPNHGSRSSSSMRFVNAVFPPVADSSPRFAISSYRNDFKMPSSHVMDRYKYCLDNVSLINMKENPEKTVVCSGSKSSLNCH